MSTALVRLRRLSRGEEQSGGRAMWSGAVASAFWERAGVVLKSDDGGWVRRAQIGQGDSARRVVVKCRALGGWWRRLRASLSLSGFDREWRGAAMLLARGIAAGRPVVLGEAMARIDGMGAPVRCEVLVLEWIEGPTLLEVMRDVAAGGPAVRAQHRLAARTGRLVAAIGAAGLHNRDLKPSNVVVRGGMGEGELVVIDCAGVRGWTLAPAVAYMLASLVIEPMGCGVRPRRALLMRGVRTVTEWLVSDEGTASDAEQRAARRHVRGVVWREVRAVVERHGDPRPRTDPLWRGVSN